MLDALANSQSRVLLIFERSNRKWANREPLIHLSKEGTRGLQLQVVGVLQHTFEDCSPGIGAFARLAFSATEKDVKVVDFVGCELELLDMLVSGLSVDDATICIDDVAFCLMTKHSFNRSDVELASCLGNDLGNLRVRAAWL